MKTNSTTSLMKPENTSISRISAFNQCAPNKYLDNLGLTS